MMTDDQLNTALAAPRPAPSVTNDRIEAIIAEETFTRLTGTLTVCVLALANGFTVLGQSACASPENFDEAIGNKLARDDAKRKIWALEGYALRNAIAAAEASPPTAPPGEPDYVPAGRKLVQVYADNLEGAQQRIRAALFGNFVPGDLQQALSLLTVEDEGGASTKEPASEHERYLEARELAAITHEANRRLCIAGGDRSQPEWRDAPEWQRDSAEKGVLFHMANPDATPEDSHESWLAEKVTAGWVYGEVKNPDADPKTHPCLRPYAELPVDQQAMDYLFRAIVHGLAPFVMKPATGGDAA